ncbi:hypothetical protein PPACK8108_LOCUS25979, partial [Phakopsora pachyrhizi]
MMFDERKDGRQKKGWKWDESNKPEEKDVPKFRKVLKTVAELLRAFATLRAKPIKFLRISSDDSRAESNSISTSNCVDFRAVKACESNLLKYAEQQQKVMESKTGLRIFGPDDVSSQKLEAASLSSYKVKEVSANRSSRKIITKYGENKAYHINLISLQPPTLLTITELSERVTRYVSVRGPSSNLSKNLFLKHFCSSQKNAQYDRSKKWKLQRESGEALRASAADDIIIIQEKVKREAIEKFSYNVTALGSRSDKELSYVKPSVVEKAIPISLAALSEPLPIKLKSEPGFAPLGLRFQEAPSSLALVLGLKEYAQKRESSETVHQLVLGGYLCLLRRER